MKINKYIILVAGLILLSSCSTSKKLKIDRVFPVHLNQELQKKFDYFFYEGLKLKEEEKYDQALDAFRFCLSVDSTDAGVLSETGVLYAIIGLSDEALNCLKNAVKYDPENWWHTVRLINLYSETNDKENAIKIAEKLKSLYPNKEEVHNMLISLYKQTKQFNKAIAALNKLESLTGIEETISFEKFRLYLELKQLKKGIDEIDKLINKYPAESRYRVLRGDIYLQQNLPIKAYEIYSKLLMEEPVNPYVYVSLSDYYNIKKEPEKAMESILKALKNEQFGVNDKVQILGQYVQNLLRDTARFNETESLFKLLVDRYPLEEQVHNYYSIFLQFRKRIPEAISALETMLNINSKNEQTWMQLIQLNLASKNFEQLVEIADRAILNVPEIPQWYYYKAISQYQLGKYIEAVHTCKTGIMTVKPEQNALKSDFYAQIADSWFKLEMKDSAFIAYEDALKINSQNIYVMNNYAYYLSLEKRELKKAERMSAITVEKEPKNSTYLDTYAWIFYQTGNYELAKIYIERAIDNLAPDHDPGVIMEHYGDILWMMKDDSKAIEMWQKSYDSGNVTDELKKKIDEKGWKR
ncbi:MAG: hypothetical protein Q7U47_08330 [Paludibacter sp.]|nr:hypothetical protein [Paludibacter sp.]